MWDGYRMTTDGIMFNTSTGEVVTPHSSMKLMQFTGKEDINEVDIYAGDIVHAHMNRTNYVVRHGEYFNLDIDYKNVTINSYGWFIQDVHCTDGETLDKSDIYLKVIGNIYENPELT